jgi:hypothetical protein
MCTELFDCFFRAKLLIILGPIIEMIVYCENEMIYLL